MTIEINQKATYSLSRLEEFKEYLSKSSDIKAQSDFCIYTTGSYGRLEASEHSDLDLFFLSDTDRTKFSKISKTLIDSDIIKACRKMKLPEFSGDGEYLEVHNIKDIYSEMGSRKDDYYNFFSARMLLLLESRAIHNQLFYDNMLFTTLEKYYKDFHQHEKNFKPIFLVNDVIRFWRTMCLNYEHNRNRKFSGTGLTKEAIEIKKNEQHIKNLKLKFSRKLTCYSFLLSVLCKDNVLKQEDILKIIKQTPLQRLESLSQNPKMRVEVEKIISLYFWFLEKTQMDKKELLPWIADEKNRDGAFEKSRDFSKAIFNLMIETDNQDNLMYFIV
ncbi:MAG: hypothetical protein IPN09_00755 [Bacteroidetes bacterium]|jgi:hypothetical protein|nr:hypothetical protein [Bacteroidota bacterium]